MTDAPIEGVTFLSRGFTPNVKYDKWIDAAVGHLHNAVDTAIGELSRDTDFLDEDDKDIISPPDPVRAYYIDWAIRRWVRSIIAEQEG